ncbi:MAG: Bcr/CflA family drug resistance efflux transporter, partial [Pseudolabrys sp.]
FLGYTIGGGCATTSLYAFIGAAPFIFSDQLHRPTHEIGLYLFLTIVVLCFGAGIASPTALAEAMSINPSIAGSASGLYGFAQMAIGALCTALGGLGGNHALAAALVLAGAGVIAQFAFWFADRRPT